MAQIVAMVRGAGASKVYLASASPPVKYPNVYGVDMPTRKEFVANNLTEEEVGKVLGADALIYQVHWTAFGFSASSGIIARIAAPHGVTSDCRHRS